MSTQKIPNLPALPPPPCCPHCNEALPVVSLYNWQHGAFMILAVYCPNLECRAVLTMQVVPAMPDERARIQMPS